MSCRFRYLIALGLLLLPVLFVRAIDIPKVNYDAASIIEFETWHNHLMAIYGDCTVRVFDVTTGKQVGTTALKDFSSRVMFPAPIDSSNLLIFRMTNAPTVKGATPVQTYELPACTRKPDSLIALGNYALGIDSTGKRIVSYNYATCQADCNDIATGKNVWHISYKDLLPETPKYDEYPQARPLADGSGIVLVFRQKVVARTPDRKVLWSLDLPAGESWDVVEEHNPGPNALVLHNKHFSQYCVVDFATGTLIDFPAQDGFFLAQANNGNALAFLKGDQIVILTRDAKKEWHTATVNSADSVDAVFGDNGKSLVVLVRKEYKANTYSRRNNIVHVYDTADGHEITKFDGKP